MKLGERLKQSADSGDEPTPTIALAGRAQTEAREPGARPTQDPLSKLKRWSLKDVVRRAVQVSIDPKEAAERLNP